MLDDSDRPKPWMDSLLKPLFGPRFGETSVSVVRTSTAARVREKAKCSNFSPCVPGSETNEGTAMLWTSSLLGGALNGTSDGTVSEKVLALRLVIVGCISRP